MFGNFVTGLAVLAPAGMLQELAAGLEVSIREAGLLIAWGGVVLCVGSPVMAWLTSKIERRRLLCATLAVMAAGHAVSALAPDYASLLVTRLVMLAVAAIFTPVAASTIAMLVPESERASKIAFVFLGWSLAIAVGLPIVSALTQAFGWRAAYGAIAATGALNFVLLAAALPSGLRGAAVSLASWGGIVRNPRIVALLAVTMLWTAGLYTVFPYLAPLLARLADAGAEVAAALFALMGISGLVGNVIATRVVARLGAYRTSLIATGAMVAGASVWAAGGGWPGGGIVAVMTVGIGIWGLGFAATNSMIQARLVAAAPAMASASVALNSSWLYVGQALGSWTGGELLVRELPRVMGVVSAGFMLAALIVLALTRERAR